MVCTKVQYVLFQVLKYQTNLTFMNYVEAFDMVFHFEDGFFIFCYRIFFLFCVDECFVYLEGQ